MRTVGDGNSEGTGVKVTKTNETLYRYKIKFIIKIVFVIFFFLLKFGEKHTKLLK